MSTRLCNKTKICNIDSLSKPSLVGSIKDGIQRDVLEHLVHPELVWVENHGFRLVLSRSNKTTDRAGAVKRLATTALMG